MSYQGRTRYPLPAMGSYVSPFLPNFISCPAVAGGDSCGWPVLTGPGLQTQSPGDVLLYRGGVKVLPTPRVESNQRVRLGLAPNCCPITQSPGSKGNVMPVAKNKSVTPCSQTGASTYVNRKTPVGNNGLPVALNIEEKFLPNINLPSGFNISSMKDTTYVLPTVFPSNAKRSTRRLGWGGKPEPGQISKPGEATLNVETSNWKQPKNTVCKDDEIFVKPVIAFTESKNTVPNTTETEQYFDNSTGLINESNTISANQAC